MLFFIVPEGIRDTSRPSGGNIYDYQLLDALKNCGVTIKEIPARGSWPSASSESLKDLSTLLEKIADGGIVLLDGLIASSASGVLIQHATRLRLIILMHMPLGCQPGANVDVVQGEQLALRAATAVIATSPWTLKWLLDNYELAPGMVHVAEPGVELAAVAAASDGGGRFVCVAAVTPHKGQDILIEALEKIADLDWQCHFIGSLELEVDFVASLKERVQESGLAKKVEFKGPLSPAALSSAYASADLLIAPSRIETFGMVPTEALARGIPVVATEVGGLPTALGFTDGHNRPGILVPTQNPSALAQVLATWLSDASYRSQLREFAKVRRLTLSSWSATAEAVTRVLEKVAA